MDILLQYLNIKKRKQEYIKIIDVPCNSIYQSVYQAFGINMADRGLEFSDYLGQAYNSIYMFVGIDNKHPPKVNISRSSISECIVCIFNAFHSGS